MSLRLQLALLLTAMLGVALFAFSAGAQFAVDHLARQATTRALAEEAQRLVAFGELQALDQKDPELGTLQLARVEMFRLSCSPTRIVNRLRRLAGAGQVLPLSEAGLHALQNGYPWIEIAALSEFEGDLYMIYSQPIIENQRWIGIAQIARSMSGHYSLLRTLRDLMIVGGGLTMLVAFGLTWSLAGCALHPLARVIRAIQTMRAQRDFGRRLQSEARWPDEISRLVAALDAALDELQSAHQQAERALAAQRTIVADVSHELRTPLTTVRGNLRLLQLDASLSDAERNAVLRDAVDEVERMSRMVNELLSLAGAEPNRSRPLALAAIELAPLAIEAARKAMAAAQGRVIFLDGSLRSTGGPVVIGNTDAMRQVLTILLDNAIKYTPADGRIVVALDVDGNAAHLHVRDTGIGIPPEDQPHIFERFYRAVNCESLPSGRFGYGLGLAIARSLVEAQGGTIHVTSEPGRGSVFTVSLRLAR